MHYITTLRQQLGISQQQMAFLLGISRPHLNLIERGGRKLPPAASAMAMELMKAMPAPIDTAVTKTMLLPPKLATELDGLAGWSAKKGGHYLLLAEEIKRRHTQASYCLNLLPAAFERATIAGADNEKARLTLQIICRDSQRLLNRYPLELSEQCRRMGTALLAVAAAANPTSNKAPLL